MEEKIWHLTNNFTKLKPQDVLKNILKDDKVEPEINSVSV